VTEKQREDAGMYKKAIHSNVVFSYQKLQVHQLPRPAFVPYRAARFLRFVCKTAGAKTCGVSRSANDDKMADLCESRRQFQTLRRHCVSFPHPARNDLSN